MDFIRYQAMIGNGFTAFDTVLECAYDCGLTVFDKKFEVDVV